MIANGNVFSILDKKLASFQYITMSLIKNTLSNILGGVAPMVVALMVVPSYLQYIGAERYGALAIIWALLGYLGFLDLGFGRAVTQRMAKQSGHSNDENSSLLWTAITISFILGLIGAFVLWISADYILSQLITIPVSNRIEASTAVIWVLLSLPIILPSSVLIGALQARLRFNELNLIQIFVSILSQLLPLTAAAYGYVELSYLVPAALVARLLSTVLLYFLCIRYIPITYKPVFNRLHLKPLLQYGGWISIMSLLAPLLVTVDRLFIGTMAGTRAVTHYTIPYDLVSKATIVSNSLSSAIFPRLASLKSVHARDMALRSNILLTAVMTPIVVAGQFLIHPFLIIWLGRDFALESANVSEIILIGVWLNSLAIPHHARLLTADNPKKVAIIYIFQIPIYFFFLWYGVTHWGVVGAAIAWSLRILIDTVMLIFTSNALADTVRLISVSLIIVVTSTLTTLCLEYDSPYRWVIGVALLLVSAIKDKDHIVGICNDLVSKNRNFHS